LSLPKSILTTGNLSVGYNAKQPLLSHLDLRLNAGQLTCLLGANGTGKSTLLRSLSGLLKTIAGTINIDGHPLSGLSAKEKAKLLSLVFTQNIAPGNLTVYAMVSLGRFPYSSWMGSLSEVDKAVIDWALNVTGTTNFANKHTDELSDGERQKVVIARALTQDTPVIFLDEPTAHLDLPTRIEIFDLLKTLAKEEGKSILMTTHHLDLALHQADQVWLIDRSRQFHQGIPEDLVLNGAIERAFAHEGLLFEKETASFKKPNEGNKPIALIGSGVYYQWTKNALERNGFSLAEEAITKIYVNDKNVNPWRLVPIESEFKSLEKLLITLKTTYEI
jgi:iron complex transport system ATP-binding protein